MLSQLTESVQSPLTTPFVGAAQWYALQTRSNFERQVSVELQAKGIETYLAAYEEVRQWKDRKKKILVPLFPGYVFSRFEDVPDIRLSALKTTGVVRILGNGARIEPIPEWQIDSVRTLLHSKIPCFAHPLLRTGDWVRVRGGALQNVEGILTRFKNRTRLVISVPLLCQAVAAEVDLADIEPVHRNGPL